MDDKQGKKLEILLIEDNPKHLESAYSFAKNLQEKGKNTQIYIASTYVDAKKIMDTKNIDGILSDVFFPYDNSPAIDGKVAGWDKQTAETAYDMLLSNPTYDEQEKEELEYCMREWKNGEKMHPTGARILKEALSKKIEIQMLTDAGRHSDEINPIMKYARENHRSIAPHTTKIIVSDNQDLIESNLQEAYKARGEKPDYETINKELSKVNMKRWDLAYGLLLFSKYSRDKVEDNQQVMIENNIVKTYRDNKRVEWEYSKDFFEYKNRHM